MLTTRYLLKIEKKREDYFNFEEQYSGLER
jgi:hypothetical protein